MPPIQGGLVAHMKILRGQQFSDALFLILSIGVWVLFLSLLLWEPS